jgi:hypothetical protein
LFVLARRCLPARGPCHRRQRDSLKMTIPVRHRLRLAEQHGTKNESNSWSGLCAAIAAMMNAARTAIAHYEELKASGVLHRNGHQFVCFDDDRSPDFEIMAKASDIVTKAKQSGDDTTIQLQSWRTSLCTFKESNARCRIRSSSSRESLHNS